MYPNVSPSRSHLSKVLAGLILLVVGVILLLEQLDYYFPDWLISWPMLLIAVGLIIGVKHQFKHPGWVIFLGIGGVFLLDRLYPAMGIMRFVGPAMVISLGLLVLFGKQHWWKARRWHEEHWQAEPVSVTGKLADGTERIDTVSVCGGVKKTVLSKHFLGGDIMAFMGGVELNLSQADIQGRVKLEVTQVLGGTKLIVPPHWDVVSEMTAVFGGIEDKRVLSSGVIHRDKVLVIEGTSVMGGIQINSYA